MSYQVLGKKKCMGQCYKIEQKNLYYGFTFLSDHHSEEFESV